MDFLIEFKIFLTVAILVMGTHALVNFKSNDIDFLIIFE